MENEFPRVAEEEMTADDLDRLYEQTIEAMEAIESHFASPMIPSLNEDEPASATQSANRSIEPSTGSDEESAAIANRPTARQIVEAALFVGGSALTVKKLQELFHGEIDRERVEAIVEQLNRTYADQHRPYVIRLGEGGYRLELRAEFETVRNRVFGVVPREVKLSQEALEVLALVAYHTPISKTKIVELAQKTPGSVLRRLVRLELVSIVRDAEGEPTYQPTERFLKLFSLRSLQELPRPEDLQFK